MADAFDLSAPEFSTPEFRMFEMKVKRCPRARPHDWTQCPFAHPGEKAKRRDPRKHTYSGTACPDFRKGGVCPRGDACPFAHGVFECWLHPSRYRTQMCTDGVNCKRRVCFFAHFESELRKPEVDPILLSYQLQRELAPDVRAYQQQQQMAHALGGLLGGQQMPPPASPRFGAQLLNGVQAPSPVVLGSVRADGSAPCTPTAPRLTPQSSQDSATLLAQLQLLQQQQAAAAAAADAAGPRPSSAPLSAGNSPSSGEQAAPARPVSASASGGTLGSSGSPPMSPTGVAGPRSSGEAGVSTPSMPDLAQPLKGPLSPLAMLLQQQQEGSAVAAQLAALLGGGGGGLPPGQAEALALLLQQHAGLGASSYDQTSLLVALHSLSLGGSLPGPPLQPAGGASLIRHASDVYMQQRAAAAVAAAALSPPGHGLVSHRRSMDNSMLAQLHSLSRSSPMPEGFTAADLAMEAARLSPIAIPSPHQHQSAADVALAMSAASQLASSLPPASPSYLATFAAAAEQQQQAAVAAAAQLQQLPLSPVAGLSPILTSGPGGEGGAGGLNLPSTPQTAPAAMARDAWNNQLCSIDEGEPISLPARGSRSAAGGGGEAGEGELGHGHGQGGTTGQPTVYKTLSDPSVLVRNLSFDNILAELPRSSSQVTLAAQQAAASGDAAAGGKQG